MIQTGNKFRIRKRKLKQQQEIKDLKHCLSSCWLHRHHKPKSTTGLNLNSVVTSL